MDVYIFIWERANLDKGMGFVCLRKEADRVEEALKASMSKGKICWYTRIYITGYNISVPSLNHINLKLLIEEALKV